MKTLFAAAAALIALGGAAASAAEIEVKMLNRGSEGGAMVFEPALVRAAPGDTIRFVPTDKGHSVEGIDKMLPEGVARPVAKMNQELLVTLEKEGTYGFKCPPHYGMGMVALVVVGDAAPNLEQSKAVSHPGKAKAAFAGLFDKYEATKTAAK